MVDMMVRFAGLRELYCGSLNLVRCLPVQSV